MCECCERLETLLHRAMIARLDYLLERLTERKLTTREYRLCKSEVVAAMQDLHWAAIRAKEEEET